MNDTVMVMDTKDGKSQCLVYNVERERAQRLGNGR